MDADLEQQSAEGRPYRSHLHPACFPCRSRKSRCKTTHGSPSCAACQAQGTDCTFPQVVERPRRIAGHLKRNTYSAERRFTASPRTQASRMRCLSSTSPTLSQRTLQSYSTPRSEPREPTSEVVTDHSERPSPSVSRPDDSISTLIDIIAKSEAGSSHIVSPAIADDDRVFQEYFSNTAYGQSRRMVRVHPSQNNSIQNARPILFSTVPRRGKREMEGLSRAAEQCEVIEQLVEPYQNDLINLFFEKVNISFPIFDESVFRKVFATHKEKISPCLLSNLYGNTLTYWRTSSKLSNIPCPDQRSVWVRAENAFNAEFVCTPGVSTIISIILNLSGRPSSHYLGNGALLGLASALANAFGLNRDPSEWNLAPSEKRFRVRIWWLLIIYDRWCSLAYGTPPLIHRTQYDVPMLNAEDLYNPGASSDQIKAASCFVALATLTEVLGHCLQYIYHLENEVSRKQDASPFDLETLLTNWEDSLDDSLRRLVIRGTQLNGPGVANLRLAYLSVKLLIQRNQLNWDRVSLHLDDIDSQHYMQARRTSEEIVDFVRELDETHLRDFWIPPNAYTLTSATTFLMRCALNYRGLVRNSPLKLARIMVDTLQAHRRNHDWDIADNCLSNCTDLVKKIEDACEASSSNTLEIQGPIPADLEMDINALNGLFPGFASTF